MNTLVLRLLINHLADIIDSLEELMDKAGQHPSESVFTKIQMSPLDDTRTYKELMPLRGLKLTLEQSLMAELDMKQGSALIGE